LNDTPNQEEIMSHNPYATPKSNISDPSGSPIKLYSPAQAACGALLGGPVGLIHFLYANFNALGNDRLKKKTLVFGAVFILLLLLTLHILPEEIPSAPFTIAYVLAAKYIAERYQVTKQGIMDSPQYDFHSNGRVWGIGFLCLIGSVLIIGGLAVILSELGVIAI
jgi:hypothetical protein